VNNTEPIATPRELSWWSFALLVLLVAGVLAWTARKDFYDPLKRLTHIGVALTFVIILVFFGVRWHQLRRSVILGELSVNDLRRDFAGHLRGPPRMWVVCIVSAVAFEVAWSTFVVLFLQPHL
jgi:hypothetical protein